MPSTSVKQAKLMAAVAHNPAFAKKVGIPQSVGKEFNKADKGRKFNKGSNTMKTSKSDMSFSKKVEADNKVKEKDAEERATKYRTDAMMEEGKKKGGMIGEYGGKESYKSKFAKKQHEAKESKSKEKMEKGMHRMPDGKMMKNSAHKKPVKKMGGGAVKYRHGGSVDGCATRGKTKGRMI